MRAERDRPPLRAIVRQRLRSRRRPNARGFSLVESLIALAIASGVLIAYFETLSATLALDRRSRARADAAIVAAGLMDRIGGEIPVEPTILSGRTDTGGTYTITITPGARVETAPGMRPYAGAALATVEIVVEGSNLPDGHRMTALRLTNGTLQ